MKTLAENERLIKPAEASLLLAVSRRTLRRYEDGGKLRPVKLNQRAIRYCLVDVTDGNYWGRLVESCVGAHLLNTSMGTDLRVTYWRDRNYEVDFVLHQGQHITAIEVKSGRGKESLPGMEAFARQYKPKRQLQVGGQGIPIDEFLSHPAAHWVE